MAAAPRCADCEVAMEEGFVLDAMFGGFGEAHWHEGSPREARFLGMPAGVKPVGTRMAPIRGWRCPECGLLRLYAVRRKWRKVE